MAPSKAAIPDVVALAAELEHDLIPAGTHRDHTVERAVRNEHARLALACVRKRSATRERDHATEEMPVREAEPERHACSRGEAADGDPQRIHSAARERPL